MPKKVVLVILTVCLLAVAFSPSLVFAAQTTDYNQYWDNDSIDYLLDENIIQGYGNDPNSIIVRPNNPISRAEFAVIINKAFNYTKAEGSNFPDVPEGAWYANDLKIAKTAAYFKGDSNGLANPTANITRAEVCAVLYQVLGLTKADMVCNTFNDQIPEWALEPILALVGKGLVNGYPDGSFKPGNSITRAESFVIVHKALEMRGKASQVPEAPQAPAVSETTEEPSSSTDQSDNESTLILKETSITVQVNSSKQITAQDYPAKDLTYTSANKEIATVNDQGLVRGQKEGTTTISVATPDGAKKATCTVTVEPRTSSGGGSGGNSKPSTTYTLDITSQTTGIVNASTYHLQGAVKASKGIAEVSYKLNDGQSVVLFTSENSGKKTSYTIDVPDIELAEGDNTIVVKSVDTSNKKLEKIIFLTYVASSKSSGKCGDNLIWSFNPDTGVLEITGSGAMYDYEDGTVPWADYCQYIAVINLPEGLTSIGDHAFYNCISLTELDFPDSLTTIGDLAFYQCSSLTTINWPKNLTSIGISAFVDCSSLNELDLPDSLTSIGYRAFYQCSSLTEINLPDSLTSIGDEAFWDCLSLTEINLPDSLTSIGVAAFWGCSSLIELDLPDSLTSIREYAFHGCSSLKEAYFRGDAPSSFGSYVFNNTASDFVIYYLEGKSGWTTPEWNGYPAEPAVF